MSASMRALAAAASTRAWSEEMTPSLRASSTTGSCRSFTAVLTCPAITDRDPWVSWASHDAVVNPNSRSHTPRTSSSANRCPHAASELARSELMASAAANSSASEPSDTSVAAAFRASSAISTASNI